jgi:predicted phage tail protein
VSAAVLREVRLYGPLRARFGRSHWLAVQSPAEAIRALCALFKGFREALQGHKGPGYRVWVGEGRQVDARSAETLGISASPLRPIRIAPVIHGGKRAGVLQIIVAVVLIVVGAWTGNGALVQAGVMMLLGGVVALLSPQRTKDGADNQTSYIFNGPVNVTTPGAPVPLLIGRVLTGSVVASAGISTDDISPPPVAPPPSPDLPPDQPLDPYDEAPGGGGGGD